MLLISGDSWLWLGEIRGDNHCATIPLDWWISRGPRGCPFVRDVLAVEAILRIAFPLRTVLLCTHAPRIWHGIAMDIHGPVRLKRTRRDAHHWTRKIQQFQPPSTTYPRVILLHVEIPATCAQRCSPHFIGTF